MPAAPRALLKKARLRVSRAVADVVAFGHAIDLVRDDVAALPHQVGQLLTSLKTEHHSADRRRFEASLKLRRARGLCQGAPQ